MATSSADKTEKPTAGKLRKARAKGDVPRSKDITMAAGMTTSLISLSLFFPYYNRLIGDSFISIGLMAGCHDDHGAMAQFMMHNVIIIFKFMLTLLPIWFAGIIASLLPGGWTFTLAKLRPNMKKINPITGFRRMFSLSHVTDIVKMLVKCAVLLYIFNVMINNSLTDFLNLQSMWFNQAVVNGFSIYRFILYYLVGTLVVFAFIDIPLSRFLFTKTMKMTKTEVKDEYKNNEGSPQVRGRIRQLQRQFALGKISRVVPNADVIITNPTHYAVALKYSPERAEAPYIIAKGQDDIAFYIREIAQLNKIEVIELPTLARAIYFTTRVNQQIPSQLYRAIAHVLTYVAQIKAWRSGQIEKPQLNKLIEIPRELLNQNGEP